MHACTGRIILASKRFELCSSHEDIVTRNLIVRIGSNYYFWIHFMSGILLVQIIVNVQRIADVYPGWVLCSVVRNLVKGQGEYSVLSYAISLRDKVSTVFCRTQPHFARKIFLHVDCVSYTTRSSDCWGVGGRRTWVAGPWFGDGFNRITGCSSLERTVALIFRINN